MEKSKCLWIFFLALAVVGSAANSQSIMPEMTGFYPNHKFLGKVEAVDFATMINVMCDPDCVELKFNRSMNQHSRNLMLLGVDVVNARRAAIVTELLGNFIEDIDGDYSLLMSLAARILDTWKALDPEFTTLSPFAHGKLNHTATLRDDLTDALLEMVILRVNWIAYFENTLGVSYLRVDSRVKSATNYSRYLFSMPSKSALTEFYQRVDEYFFKTVRNNLIFMSKVVSSACPENCHFLADGHSNLSKFRKTKSNMVSWVTAENFFHLNHHINMFHFIGKINYNKLENFRKIFRMEHLVSDITA